MLKITEISSFKMERKMPDGTTTSARRYVYRVTGDADLLTQYKQGCIEKRIIGGMLANDGTLRYYSWRKCINGTGSLIQTKKGWFIDTKALDDIASIIEQNPALGKIIAPTLTATLINQIDADAEQDEQDTNPENPIEDEDGAPF